MNTKGMVVIGLVVVSLTTTLRAQDSTKSWWSSKPTTENRSSSFFGTSNKSSSSMFKLPSFSKSKSKPSKSNSTMSKMGRSTKKAWNDTLDFMNPFNDSKPKTTQSHGYQSNYWNDRSKPQQKKAGMFDWMWPEEKEKNEIKSVNDFLALPSPSF